MMIKFGNYYLAKENQTEECYGWGDQERYGMLDMALKDRPKCDHMS